MNFKKLFIVYNKQKKKQDGENMNHLDTCNFMQNIVK